MYVKLFSSIYQGTLRGNSHGLLVFTNLLAHADQEGFVDIHPRAISEEVGLPIEDVRKALLMLEDLDPESRTNELEGRRIVRIDEHRAWGWQIVNYVKYRKIRNEDDRREQNREAQQRWRDKQNNKHDADNKQSKPQSAHADTDADTKKEKKASKPAALPFVLPEWMPVDAWQGYVEMRAKIRKSMTERARTLQIKKLNGYRISGYDIAAILDNSTANDWTDLYEPKAANVVPMNSGRVRV